MNKLRVSPLIEGFWFFLKNQFSTVLLFFFSMVLSSQAFLGGMMIIQRNFLESADTAQSIVSIITNANKFKEMFSNPDNYLGFIFFALGVINIFLTMQFYCSKRQRINDCYRLSGARLSFLLVWNTLELLLFTAVSVAVGMAVSLSYIGVFELKLNDFFTASDTFGLLATLCALVLAYFYIFCIYQYNLGGNEKNGGNKKRS